MGVYGYKKEQNDELSLEIHVYVLLAKKNSIREKFNKLAQIITILKIKFQESGMVFSFLCIADILMI